MRRLRQWLRSRLKSREARPVKSHVVFNKDCRLAQSSVATDITEVNRDATKTGAAAGQVLSSARRLSKESVRLREELDQIPYHGSSCLKRVGSETVLG